MCLSFSVELAGWAFCLIDQVPTAIDFVAYHLLLCSRTTHAKLLTCYGYFHRKQGYQYGTTYLYRFTPYWHSKEVCISMNVPTFWIVHHWFKNSRIPKMIRNQTISRRVGNRLNSLSTTKLRSPNMDWEMSVISVYTSSILHRDKGLVSLWSWLLGFFGDPMQSLLCCAVVHCPYRNSNHVTTQNMVVSRQILVGCSKQAATAWN